MTANALRNDGMLTNMRVILFKDRKFYRVGKAPGMESGRRILVRSLKEWVPCGAEGSLAATRHQISQTFRRPFRRSGTAILAQQKLMAKEEAVPALRHVFARLYDDSQRNSGF